MLAVLIGLAVVPFLVSQTAWIARTPFENPPDALAQKARDLMQRFGYTDKPVDTARGFSYDDNYLQDLARHGKSRSTLAHLSAAQPPPIRFWYRSSPRYLVAERFGEDAITTYDPPMTISSMVKIELDPQGRLVSFAAVPPQHESPGVPAKPLDGSALLTAAGLDPARFQPAEPEWTPLASFDQRAAWTGTFPDDPNPLRIESASWRGKLIFFSVINPWTRPERMQPVQYTRAQTIGQVIGLILLSAIIIGGCLLARHNIRLGRGDPGNAFRLTGFLFCLTVGAWAFAAHHVPANAELRVILMGLATCLLAAAVIWVLYVALEPFVRRRWPQTIISWTRILAGRLRDPVVGGHVLIGVAYGVVNAAVLHLLLFIRVRSTGVPESFIQMSTIQGVTDVVSDLLGVLPNSVLSTLGIFFILFLLRTILRREWLAAATFVAGLTLIGTGLSETTALIGLPLRVLQYCLMIFVMLRFGLLPFAVGEGVTSMLLLFPVTADFSAWYAGSGIFALAFIVVLAGFAFHTALAGRPVFKANLLDS